MKTMMTLVDIGAAGGIPTRWSKIKDLRVVEFEPEKEAFEKLKSEIKPNKIILNAALYKEARPLDFYVTKSPTDSSVLKPNYSFVKQFPCADRFKVTSTSRISADMLDNQLKQHNVNDVDFIKLDTQGSELFILEGSKETLSKAFGIEIECEFQQIYEGQPLFGAIDAFLNKFGFRVFDLRNVYWKRKTGRFLGGDKGQLIYVEALYFKDLENIPKHKIKVAKAVEISLLYGYADYAMEIIEYFSNLFEPDELAEYKSRLQTLSRFTLPKLLRNAYVYRALLRLARFFRPPLWKGVSSNDELGNLEF
jgi:FkbM family methyltransferase